MFKYFFVFSFSFILNVFSQSGWQDEIKLTDTEGVHEVSRANDNSVPCAIDSKRNVYVAYTKYAPYGEANSKIYFKYYDSKQIWSEAIFVSKGSYYGAIWPALYIVPDSLSYSGDEELWIAFVEDFQFPEVKYRVWNTIKKFWVNGFKNNSKFLSSPGPPYVSSAIIGNIGTGVSFAINREGIFAFWTYYIDSSSSVIYNRIISVKDTIIKETPLTLIGNFAKYPFAVTDSKGIISLVYASRQDTVWRGLFIKQYIDNVWTSGNLIDTLSLYTPEDGQAWLALDHMDRIHLTYQHVSAANDDEVVYRMFDGSTWSDKQVIFYRENTSTSYPSIAIDTLGNPWIFYENGYIFYKKYNGNDWSENTQISFMGSRSVRPWSINDKNGNIHIGYVSAFDTSAAQADAMYRTYVFNETTNIIKNNKKMPNKFTLWQNYPNPFNLQTAIDYYIPLVSFIEIEIYNVNGKKVKKYSEKKSAGNHRYLFNAEGLSSGIYFYSLKINGKISKTKKMIFIK